MWHIFIWSRSSTLECLISVLFRKRNIIFDKIQNIPFDSVCHQRITLTIQTIKAMPQPILVSNGLLKNGFKWRYQVINCKASEDFSRFHLFSNLSSFLFPKKILVSSSSRGLLSLFSNFCSVCMCVMYLSLELSYSYY